MSSQRCSRPEAAYRKETNKAGGLFLLHLGLLFEPSE
jgi:hypothetical protein